MPANLAAYQCQRKDVTYFNKSYTQQTVAGGASKSRTKHKKINKKNLIINKKKKNIKEFL